MNESIFKFKLEKLVEQNEKFIFIGGNQILVRFGQWIGFEAGKVFALGYILGKKCN